MKSKERICKCGNPISPNSKSKRCEACNNRKVSAGKKIAAGVVFVGGIATSLVAVVYHKFKK